MADRLPRFHWQLHQVVLPNRTTIGAGVTLQALVLHMHADPVAITQIARFAEIPTWRVVGAGVGPVRLVADDVLAASIPRVRDRHNRIRVPRVHSGYCVGLVVLTRCRGQEAEPFETDGADSPVDLFQRLSHHRQDVAVFADIRIKWMGWCCQR